MKKILFILVLFLLLVQKASALDVVYPSKTYSKVSAAASFIVGSIGKDEKLYINDNEVKTINKGLFAYAVKLNPGKNEFEIKTDNKRLLYVIERSLFGANYKPAVFNKYTEPKILEIVKNNSPIRTTAVQSGINRLVHLQKGILLRADGELGDMYRLELSSNKYAWIAKSDVKIVNGNYDKAFLFDNRDKYNKENHLFEFALSKKTPYSVEEKDGALELKIYNVAANPNDTAIFKITYNQRLMGYDVKYRGDVLVLSIKNEPKITKKNPLKDVKIVVDAGHGGSELGAVSCSHHFEKDFNLSISKYLEEDLKKMGAKVYMTRTFDKFVSLNDRVKYTNTKEAQIFVSIHANSLPDAIDPMTRRGFSIYYYYPEARPLCDAIKNSVSKNININNEGIKQASFAVVRNTSAVSVLVETAYVINPFDNELLLDENFRKSYAMAIAQGIRDYVVQNKTKISLFSKNKIKCVKIS